MSTGARTKLETLQAICDAIGVEAFTAPSYRPGLIRHIVLFRLQSEATPAQRDGVTQRFLQLQDACRRHGEPYILSIETGAQSSGEGADGGFEQGFVVTFGSEGDRNYYVGTPVVTDAHYYDPAHSAYKESLAGLLLPGPAGVLVFDFAIADLACPVPSSFRWRGWAPRRATVSRVRSCSTS